jgi:hypothetical protein
MKYLLLFENYEPNQYKTAEEICDYIIDLKEDDIPDFFLRTIKNDNCMYELKTVNIQDVINNDSDVKDYVLNANDRYEDTELDDDYSDIDKPIVIHKNEVFDGYNRLLVKYHNGEKEIAAWVSIMKDYNEIVEELKDMLIPLRQDNTEYLYDVSKLTYRHNELLSIDARIWKNGNFFTEENLEEIKPVIKQMVSYINSTEEFDHIVLLVNYWDEEGEEENSYFEYDEEGYDSLIDYDTIVGIKLKFVK